ncbi:DNA GLYCOSYLASE SUPERFAMILY PROTEIN [Salix viminalis]|uniref:DNA GLYCOSYLASE SUPERFAMILY PROTEIN n=1 Tax=Salix viminalis TaxID=40686 RepID=A0A6N2N9F5_SALVM|nr:DNA GLYCOSYLASE SUPERFAMILY PROTEIN [Salix viminalis]
MSVAAKLRSAEKQTHEPPRAILGPAGNRVRVLEEAKRKIEVLKKSQQKPKKPVEKMSQAAVKNNLSVDSTCSSDSYSSSSSSGRNVKLNGIKHVKDVPNGGEIKDVSSKKEGPVKRCDWITPNSDPLYMSFHDEEWGIPVHDDRKLFELLVFSQALAELSWLAILHMRDIFRKLFDQFDPSSIAQFTEKKLLSLKVNGNLLLSEPKLRAIVENAKQILKIQQEFGSFSNYCWRFVNQKPLRNGFRYVRQVPAKTPKAELMSKDLMQRGFRCVGPTVVYSFMQVAGIVNDHLISCFRYQECNADVEKNFKSLKSQEIEIVVKALGNTCLSRD